MFDLGIVHIGGTSAGSEIWAQIWSPSVPHIFQTDKRDDILPSQVLSFYPEYWFLDWWLFIPLPQMQCLMLLNAFHHMMLLSNICLQLNNPKHMGFVQFQSYVNDLGKNSKKAHPHEGKTHGFRWEIPLPNGHTCTTYVKCWCWCWWWSLTNLSWQLSHDAISNWNILILAIKELKMPLCGGIFIS